MRDAVDFCSRTFDAFPVYSEPDPEAIPIDEKFDPIWCGSLLTHIDSDRAGRFLDFFIDRMEEDGVFVFTTHGRHCVLRGDPDDQRWREITREFIIEGFGYRDYPSMAGYGTSISKASWILEALCAREDITVIEYVERGWNDHQDVAGVLKSDIHHRQGARLIV